MKFDSLYVLSKFVQSSTDPDKAEQAMSCDAANLDAIKDKISPTVK